MAPDLGTEADELREVDAVLRSHDAGARVIRGGVLRTAGYAAGTVAGLVASVVLLRYLGVVDVGRYVTVMSLLAIASGVTDVGLTVIGQREYAILPTEAARRRLLATIVALRLVLTPIGVIAVTLFAIAAGYDRTLVLGTLIGGVGVVITNIGLTLTVPLTVQLRLGAVTATEVIKQVVTALGLVLLALAGAGLLAFFGITIVAGIATFIVAAVLSGPAGRVRPRFEVGTWWPLLREAAPVALSLVVNVIYVRILIVLMSLLATADQTGYFATSYRMLEVFLVVPMLMIGSAFPVLAHAGEGDERRLAYALQRIGEVSLLAALGIVLLLTFGARPILDLLGGDQYGPAVPVLQIQSLSLIGAFLTQVWVAGLIAIRRQSALILTNLVGLILVLVLGLSLIPTLDAKGAAIAALAGESVLAVVTLVMLVRSRPDLRPYPWVAARGVLAALIGAGAALASGLPDAGAAALALVVFVIAAFALRAVPLELVHAFRTSAVD